MSLRRLNDLVAVLMFAPVDFEDDRHLLRDGAPVGSDAPRLVQYELVAVCVWIRRLVT
jgi:hypothetical protein